MRVDLPYNDTIDLSDAIWVNPSIQPEVEWIPSELGQIYIKHIELFKKMLNQKLVGEEELLMKNIIQTRVEYLFELGFDVKNVDDLVLKNYTIAFTFFCCIENVPNNHEFYSHLMRMAISDQMLLVVDCAFQNIELHSCFLGIFIIYGIEFFKTNIRQKLKIYFCLVLQNIIEFKVFEESLVYPKVLTNLEEFCHQNSSIREIAKIKQKLNDIKDRKERIQNK